jgi:hypothetical protein
VVTDVYWRLAAGEREANPPRDLTREWERMLPLDQASIAARVRIEHWAQAKGFTVQTLRRMGVRHRAAQGAVKLAYAVRTAETLEMPAGAIVGIKVRDLDGSKSCVPGSRLAYPAVPTLLGNPQPERVLMSEGETDAAWLFERASDSEAILCCHAGAGVFCREWVDSVPSSAGEIYLASDNDWDREPDHAGVANIGDRFAERWAAALAGVGRESLRLRPPHPARDWCEVAL